MNGLTNWLERTLMPVASKIGQQRHLAALRDAFLAILPATMVGTIAVALNALLGTFPNSILQAMGKEPNFDGSTIPVIKQIMAVDGVVWQGTFAIIGLLFAAAWGFHLAKSYDVEPFTGAIVSVGTLFAGLNTATSIVLGFAADPKTIKPLPTGDALAEATAKFEAGKTFIEQLKTALEAGGVTGVDATGAVGGLNMGQLGATSYFAVMIMGGIAVTIYAKMAQTNIKIKLPEQVPPMVSRPFEAIIPAAAALYGASIIYYVVQLATKKDVMTLIAEYIAKPFTVLSQSVVSVVVVTAAVSLLWLCGLHGPNVLGGVLDGIWLPQLLENTEKYNASAKTQAAISTMVKNGDLHLWVRNSFDIYAWMGGSGGTIVLLVAILIFSKRDDYRAISKLGIGPGFFNINEPVLFGMPIVLNPVFAIPFVLAPVVSVIIGYAATAAHLVNPAVIQTPWVTPPIMNAWMATGFDWRAVIVSALCLVVGFVIFLPFVLAANKMEIQD
ncbi:PTS system, cellobiose-specific IIC component [Pilibacter termitis]|uniref:PTS system, cellobiose-specific IIC component n=1 Tax=Pilibacter termitis TaxID=263852 RepID=A0A1T4KDY9_9ENTE|nr:PTS transporter subunit EIIC [Pilibacter termitis]SJZ40642.1 PTS system, cellobiose-specific IIC component [Pilibacter termitis]